MKVIEIKEQDDGSAIITLDLFESEVQHFLEVGIIKTLKDAIEYEESLINGN